MTWQRKQCVCTMQKISFFFNPVLVIRDNGWVHSIRFNASENAKLLSVRNFSSSWKFFKYHSLFRIFVEWKLFAKRVRSVWLFWQCSLFDFGFKSKNMIPNAVQFDFLLIQTHLKNYYNSLVPILTLHLHIYSMSFLEKMHTLNFILSSFHKMWCQQMRSRIHFSKHNNMSCAQWFSLLLLLISLIFRLFFIIVSVDDVWFWPV